MMTLFIAFGVYVVEDLDPKLMLSNAFFLISLRSVLAPAMNPGISIRLSELACTLSMRIMLFR